MTNSSLLSFNINITQIKNYCYKVIGNNNSIYDNVNIKNTCKSLAFIHVDFTTKNGKIFYYLSMMIFLLLWTFFIFCLNPILFLIAMTLIPTLFFVFGQLYLKQNEDQNHLKINKTLIMLIFVAILLFFVIALFFPLIGKPIITAGCILMAFDLIVSLALYLNALGGNKIVDFIMGTFISFPED